MFQEHSLLKLTKEELMELLTYYPINQVVKWINIRCLEDIQELNKNNSNVLNTEFESILDVLEQYSEDYLCAKRAIGPSSWFYEYLSKEPWYKYKEFSKNYYSKENYD